jgi:hypothetical protein
VSFVRSFGYLLTSDRALSPGDSREQIVALVEVDLEERRLDLVLPAELTLKR